MKITWGDSGLYINDIEGMEYEVLQSFDLIKRGPNVLTLEIMKNDKGKASEVKQLLDRFGHCMWCRTGTNYTLLWTEYSVYI